MKFEHAIVSLFASVVLSLHAAVVNISSDPASNEKQTPLSLTTNDVLFIQTPSGGTAVVQFTSFGANKADYRWRYRAAKSQPIQSGEGQVVESYDRKRRADGNIEVVRKDDHDTTLRAGEIWIEWSQGRPGKGWLYYRPGRAKVQILKPDAFEKEL